jgi:hypothetical protein
VAALSAYSAQLEERVSQLEREAAAAASDTADAVVAAEGRLAAIQAQAAADAAAVLDLQAQVSEAGVRLS